MSLEEWVPRTKIGWMIKEGKIKSISELFANHFRITEVEIVDYLLPGLEQEIIDINLVQKQTAAGERSKFRAIAVVGNRDGFVGLGTGKAVHVVSAIEKAVKDAKMNLIPVRRGCGSWECACGASHSVPVKVVGKQGSVKIELIPGPRGLGIVAGEAARVVLELAGIEDVWTRTYGETRTTLSFASATYEALKNTNKIILPTMW
ncbi:MAG: 30S ribosomal protein S5 [Nitrososphaeria archaeon]|nr:30S ribosomal protein S5 [Aigarchaeota archaeon]MCX8187857.1 30S ribosomal protein S5 [Nitrososphaeria archaeon]MDW8021720.1 30S ribosomal protein S5 [Nitrososphaerota archaeon]